MRLFIAVNFTDEIKNSLHNSVIKLKQAAAQGSFTHRENLHLTLVFIGETDRAEAVKRAMDAVEALPFELSIGGFGKFKRGGKCIYWVGVEKSMALAALYAKLCGALEKQGFETEERDLSPHITLGRNVAAPPDFDESEFAKGVPRQSMRVGHISLMKSERTGGRLTYTEIYRKPLVSKGNHEYA
ncbi:MAG: RNA 2',3'-cyclic phosphodiesterase [Bacillota bacterium]